MTPQDSQSLAQQAIQNTQTQSAVAAQPNIIQIAHASNISAADILAAVTSSVTTVAPVVVQTLPAISPNVNAGKISAIITLGELGLAALTNIFSLIKQKQSGS